MYLDRSINQNLLATSCDVNFTLPVAAFRVPTIDHDKVPREITVRAGQAVDIEVPYSGQ